MSSFLNLFSKENNKENVKDLKVEIIHTHEEEEDCDHTLATVDKFSYVKTYSGDKTTLPVKPDGWTRFVCFSDTHGSEDKIPENHMIEADVLLHAGDFTDTGKVSQIQKLNTWLGNYPAKNKVIIAGNHDITLQKDFYAKNYKNFFHKTPEDCDQAREALTLNNACIYLEDEMVEIEGYKIYGSPWQPTYGGWAFNLDAGLDIDEKWKLIPDEVDVLITHGPAYKHGDTVGCQDSGLNVGCQDLRRHILQRIANPVHISGHIHEGYGTTTENASTFVNASTCTLRYKPTNPPIVIDLPPVDILRRQYAEERKKHKRTSLGILKRIFGSS